jgi:hypothetical protein
MIDSSLFSTIVGLIDKAEDTDVSGNLKLFAVQTALESTLGDDYEKYAEILNIVIDGIVTMKKTDPAALPPRKRKFTRLFLIIDCLVVGIRRCRK